MTTTADRARPPLDPLARSAWGPGATLQDWDPDDHAQWEAAGRVVARRNLVWSILAEHLGFSVWLLWSATAALLPAAGFAFSPAQLFGLVAIPHLVGALVRLPYTMAVARLGGRTWTAVSTAALLVPTLLLAWVVQQPGTPYWVFCLVAATAGLGGGSFASSMANVNRFYPARAKGTVLGLNAAGGNLGVAVVQLLGPLVVGIGASTHLENAGYLYAALVLVAAGVAWRRMNDIAGTSAGAREVVRVLRLRDTWVLSFLYVGTFGSFVGFSAALPLLIGLRFSGSVPHVAFVGALVGAAARPLGGWLADRYGGARVTLWSFGALMTGAVAVLLVLRAGAGLPVFLLAFVVVFAASGLGNGSTYRMIPLVMPTADRAGAVIGVAGAVGALGGFLVPMTFAAPWVADPVAAVQLAFVVFTGFYALCLTTTWVAYARSREDSP